MPLLVFAVFWYSLTKIFDSNLLVPIFIKWKEMKIIQLFYLLHIFKFYGALFPIESESREIKVLDGLWNFRIDDSTNRNLGFIQEWYSKALKKVSAIAIYSYFSKFCRIIEVSFVITVKDQNK